MSCVCEPFKSSDAPERVCTCSRKRETNCRSDSLTGQLLVWDGRDVLMVDAWENVVSLVRHPGQAALQLVALPVAAYAAEVANLAEVARRPDARRAVG
jgi:hypothetical protein